MFSYVQLSGVIILRSEFEIDLLFVQFTFDLQSMKAWESTFWHFFGHECHPFCNRQSELLKGKSFWGKLQNPICQYVCKIFKKDLIHFENG